MELFTINIKEMKSEASALWIQQLSERLASLHTTLNQDGPNLVVRGELPRFQLALHGKKVIRAIASACTEYVLDQEMLLLRQLLMKEYQYKNEEELAAIEKHAKHLIDLTSEEEENTGLDIGQKRAKKIEQAFQEYLEEHTLLILEGFIRFRLQHYHEELREMAEYAVDEYIMDQQYQEFISLLKYFVYIQDAKIPIAHLVHQGERDFVLLNEQMKPIETEQMDQFVVELIDKEVNYEDLIVSTLISVSPQKIFIHTRHPDMQVIRTIQQIFEDRAKLCTYCNFCKPLLGERNHKDQMSP
ncbi:putative sporulation protein YtxC [Paenibacillus turpanensis]|uniref:putative sporulation protein YtxC n=1 Tax=Paenibacillus turpanensis TaxID=2689078 RepID=UPI0014076E85|nr:putative sporulation protein YtxC [Paenibacillus turpanensis]